MLIKDDQQSCDRLGTAIIMYILIIVFEEFQSGYFACALHLREWPSGLATIVLYKEKLSSATNLSKDFTGWCPFVVLEIVGSYGGSRRTRTRLHCAVLWDHTCMITMMGSVYSSSKSQDETLKAGAGTRNRCWTDSSDTR